MKKIIVLFFLSISILAAKPRVSVSILPLEYIVEKITLNKFYHMSLFDENYINEFPSKKKIRKLSYSPIFLSMNLPREKKYIKDLQEISNIKVVDITKGIDKLDNNPYIWMDPIIFRQIVLNVYEQILKLDREHKSFYENNLNKLLKNIDEIFLVVRKQLNNAKSYNFYTFDKYWDYYAKRYRLNLIKKEKHKLSAKEIYETIVFARENSINKTLVDEHDSKKIISFFAQNSETQIIKNNIFKKNWQSNIFILTQKLSEENNK